MKELRPGSTGRTEIRVLLAFDLEREAIPSRRRRQERRLERPVREGTSPSPTTASTSTRSASRPRGRPPRGRPPRSKRRRRQTEEGQGTTMSMNDWEKKVLAEPGAAERVAEIEDELRLAAGLTALREQAGLSQRDVARLIGVSQPRIAATRGHATSPSTFWSSTSTRWEASWRSPFEGATASSPSSRRAQLDRRPPSHELRRSVPLPRDGSRCQVAACCPSRALRGDCRSGRLLRRAAEGARRVGRGCPVFGSGGEARPARCCLTVGGVVV